MKPGEYTIGDLAGLYGLSLRTLRFYEERELLRPRREGGQRIFSESDRIRLEFILRAKRLRFSLAAIWELIESRATKDSRRLTASTELIGLSKDEICAQINHLTRERARVDDAIAELRAIAAQRLG